MRTVKICKANTQMNDTKKPVTIIIDSTADRVVGIVQRYTEIQIEDVWEMEAQILFDTLINLIPGGMYNKFRDKIIRYEEKKLEDMGIKP